MMTSQPAFRLICLTGTVLAGLTASSFAQEGTATTPVTEAEKIIVTASRIPMSANRVGSAVTILTSDVLEKRGDQYVADALRDVPGLSVSRSGSFGAQTLINLRGTESNHVLVVIDGIEVNDQSSGSEFDFGRLLVSDIERIEVLRGSQSALWGSDAIGGVINIVTKAGKGPLNGYVSGEVGSFRTGRVDAAVRGGNDTFNGALSVSEYTTDGISQADEDLGNPENDAYRISTVQGKFQYRPLDNLTFDLVGRYSRSFLEADSFFGGVGAVDSDEDTETHQHYGLIGAQYSLLDGRWTHQVRAAYTKDADKSRFNNAISTTAVGTKRKYDYQTTYRFVTPAFAAAEHAATLLLEDETDRMTASYLGAGALETTNKAAAFEYNLSLWNALHLSASGRQDDNDRFKDVKTYRTTLAYEFHDWGGRLHNSYGTGIKNPTLTELFGFSATFVGNPNLRPEKNKGWDIGYEQNFWEGRITADITYFNNRATNLIVGAGNTALNLEGTSPAEGIEFSADIEINDSLSLSGSYTYTNAETADGTEQTRRPRHLASLNANYAFMDGRANANLGLNYVGEKNDYTFDAFFNRSVVKLDSYVLVNLQASYDLTDRVRLFARGENLLDEDYQEIFTYGTPGISAFGGVRVSF